MKKVAKIVFSSALLLSPILLSSQVEAKSQEVEANSQLESSLVMEDSINVLVPYEPSVGQIQPYGANPPKSDASVHDISVNAYNYQVQQVGFAVYTDKLIKGKTSMKVTVKDFERISGSAKDVGLTISLYNASTKKLVASKALAVHTSNSVSFSGLSSSTKYYVEFTVYNNGNKYSFNGSIQ